MCHYHYHDYYYYQSLLLFIIIIVNNIIILMVITIIVIAIIVAIIIIQVSALLLELAAMKQADPTAKAVVFSSWSRLLRLVEEALKDNNICYTSIAGAQADSRVAALHRFMKEPECTVLTVVMSTGGGAAGLTLTVASHVFLLEPNLNPGLEAQAAARVYRLGKLCKQVYASTVGDAFVSTVGACVQMR